MKMNELIRQTALSALETQDFELLQIQRNKNSTCYMVNLHRMIPFWMCFKHGFKNARSEKQALQDWETHLSELIAEYVELLENQKVYIRLNNKFKQTHYRDPNSPDPAIEFLLGVPMIMETIKGQKQGQVLFGISVPESIVSDCDDYIDRVVAP